MKPRMLALMALSLFLTGCSSGCKKKDKDDAQACLKDPACVAMHRNAANRAIAENPQLAKDAAKLGVPIVDGRIPETLPEGAKNVTPEQLEQKAKEVQTKLAEYNKVEKPPADAPSNLALPPASYQTASSVRTSAPQSSGGSGGLEIGVTRLPDYNEPAERQPAAAQPAHEGIFTGSQIGSSAR